MRFSATIFGAALLSIACNGSPVAMFGEGSGTSGTSGTSGETGGTSGADTVADTCVDGMDILGHCYHQIVFENIIRPDSAVAGDFNDDASQDVVTLCRGTSESYAICLLDVATGFITKLDVNWLKSGEAEVHAADFNNDGVPDVLVSEIDHFAVFTVEDDEFVLYSEFISDYTNGNPSDAGAFPAVPIDIDRDGVAEVAAGWYGVRLWRLEPGGWAPAGERQPVFGCGDLQSPRAADLDGDGFPELVAIGSHNNCGDAPWGTGSSWDRISIFTGDGLGVGIAPMSDFEAHLEAARLDLGDFNNDGHVDIIVGDQDVSMMVFAGNGDGTFEPPLPLINLANFSGTGPIAADFNADGFDEILVEQADESYRILVGLPMTTAVELPWPVAQVLLARDLNADGRADIVTSTESNGKLRLVLALSEP